MAKWSKTAVFTNSSSEESCFDPGSNLPWDYDINCSKLEIISHYSNRRAPGGNAYYIELNGTIVNQLGSML